MKHIGIVCPLWVEAEALLSWHSEAHIYKYKKRSWIEFNWNGYSIIIVVSKIGKANAAKATHLLIERYTPQLIVNFGSAGAIAPDVFIGQAVVSTATAEYGEHPLKPAWTPMPQSLISLAQSIEGIVTGPIVSADKNIESDQQKQQLFDSYQAICGDWESAVVMKVCHEYQVSALAFRVISDLGDAQAMLDFKKHHQAVLTQAGDLLQQYLRCWIAM